MIVLLISNQEMKKGVIGNPVMLRMHDALLADYRVDEVLMQGCKNPLKDTRILRNKARAADVIHIHFGGMYALIVWVLLMGIKKPKLITFHGTDIHAKTIRTAKSWKAKVRIRLNQWASFFCIIVFDRVGFVASDMLEYVPKNLEKLILKKSFIQKLGVDYHLFTIVEKKDAQRLLNLEQGFKYILFSDISGSSIKRRDIAMKITKQLGSEYRLNIMSGVNPNEVPLFINASDFLLLTSDEEGSPNIIRECLSLNKPVFSVNVGDAKKQIEGLKNSSIISRDEIEAANTIKKVEALPYTDNTRTARQNVLDMNFIIKEVISIYQELA